jgi:hypothetical protein
MTITAFEAGTPVPVATRPTNTRDALINTARCRYTLSPDEVAAVLDRHAPGLRPEHRWHWLDALAHLADQLAALDTVGSSDDARAVLQEMREGPWDEPYAEALTRRDEISAEIDDMIREAQ